MLNIRELPLLSTRSECGFTEWIGWGHMLAGKRGLRKFLCLLFICLCTWMEKREITVIPAVTAQSLLIAFWTLPCFFLFFFFSYRETKCSCTAWLTHCLIALHTPPHPIFFKSSSILFFIPASQFAFRWKWLLFKQSHNSTVTRDFFYFIFILGLIRHQNSSVTSIFHLLDTNKDGR